VKKNNPMFGYDKYNITKEFFVQEYSKNKKLQNEIARKIGCSSTYIRDKLIKYNIPIRTKSETMKGKNKGKEANRYNPERHKTHYCKELNCNNEITYSGWKYYGGRCKSCASKRETKKLWQNEKFREKVTRAIFKASKIKPNKPEKKLNRLLQKLLPEKYRYVGAGQIILGGFNPDFINCNGQKKIIELYGNYWHNLPAYKKRDKRRLVTYKKYGYKTLVIWQYELKDMNRLIEKILQFNGE